MTHELYDLDEKHHMNPMLAMLAGIGIGVVGTVVVLAANEKKFHNVVTAGRTKARDIGSKIKERFEDTVDDVKDGVAETAHTARKSARHNGG